MLADVSMWWGECSVISSDLERQESKNRKERNTMSVNLIFKIAAVGILVTVIGQVLKHRGGREEQRF